MSDLIRRSDAIEAITYSHLDNLTREERIALINAIPSADRQQEWMPCSERLPKESGQYLVTAGIEQRQVAKGYYSAEYGRWYAVSDVSAWMPLPKPWKGEDDK